MSSQPFIQMEGGGYEITITVVIKSITIIIVIVTIISKPSSLKESVADEDVVRLRGLSELNNLLGILNYQRNIARNSIVIRN